MHPEERWYTYRWLIEPYHALLTIWMRFGTATMPDEAYFIGTDREIPDLVIEVIVTSGSLNKL
jgi:Uma2 family endonuclease